MAASGCGGISGGVGKGTGESGSGAERSLKFEGCGFGGARELRGGGGGELVGWVVRYVVTERESGNDVGPARWNNFKGELLRYPVCLIIMNNLQLLLFVFSLCLLCIIY